MTQPWMTKRIFIIGGSLLAGVLIVILVLVWLLERNDVVPSSPQNSVQKTTAGGSQAVQVVTPQRRDLVRSLTTSANVSPWAQATLYGKVSGYLKWIGFDKGDAVKKGTLLAVIDAPEIEDRFKQAEADHAIKKITYERYLGVWQENHDMIAKQDVDVANAAAESARHVRDSRATLLGYTKVYAPFSGVITARFADVGALIQSATGSATQAAPLFTIMDLEKLRVYISIPQEVSSLAKPGIPVTLTSDAMLGKEIKATITRTTEALDPATRTLLVEVDVPNETRRLEPGMFIKATVLFEQHSNSLALPPAAIVSDKASDKSWVFVVENGKARRVSIRTGIDDGVWVEVVEGLTGDEQVVVVGKGGLTDGRAVISSPYDLPAGENAQQKM
ncbi:MAG: efflux RND transporter periplasmic adaptor subunit [Nitrospiraceae bacterium]